MATSIRMLVFACALLAGCGSTFPVGLANAPGLGGDTPETRVHDVVANGHDSCERSGFPQGDVLRGHVPPCATEQKRIVAAPAPSATPSSPGRWLSPLYPTGVCPHPGLGLTAAEMWAGTSRELPEQLACVEP
jgi:hypothetical protein